MKSCLQRCLSEALTGARKCAHCDAPVRIGTLRKFRYVLPDLFEARYRFTGKISVPRGE